MVLFAVNQLNSLLGYEISSIIVIIAYPQTLVMRTKDKWLEIGFRHFAEFGPDQISIKRMADELNVPRSTFYHYFGDKDNLIEELLIIYLKAVDEYVAEGTTTCKKLIPDLHVLLYKYIDGLKFSRQLLINRHNPIYNLVYTRVRKKANKFIIPLFVDYYNFNIPYKTAEDLWDSLSDSWYSRLDPNKISVEYMIKLTEEIMDVVLTFVQSRLFGNIN